MLPNAPEGLNIYFLNLGGQLWGYKYKAVLTYHSVVNNEKINEKMGKYIRNINQRVKVFL